MTKKSKILSKILLSIMIINMFVFTDNFKMEKVKATTAISITEPTEVLDYYKFNKVGSTGNEEVKNTAGQQGGMINVKKGTARFDSEDEFDFSTVGKIKVWWSNDVNSADKTFVFFTIGGGSSAGWDDQLRYGKFGPVVTTFDASNINEINKIMILFGGNDSNSAIQNSYNAYIYSIKLYPKNEKPQMNISLPENNAVYSETDTGFIPSITVSDMDNDTLTCKYYIESKTSPNDTKTVASTVSTKKVLFKPFDMGTLSEGSHSMKFEVNDAQETVVKTVDFKVDKSPPDIKKFDAISTTSDITLSGNAIDDIGGLDPFPYRYTIASNISNWVTSQSYTQRALLPNTKYSVQFEVRDRNGHIASSTQNVYTKAKVPTIIVGNPTSTTLDLTIADNNPNNTAYQIINTSNNNYITPLGEETTSPTWVIPQNKAITINGLTPLTTYTYKVKAKNEEGVETEFSSPTSGTTLAPPPEKISEVTATSTSNEITIYWSPVANATSYEVEADGEIIDTGTNVSYTHTELLPDTEHTYRVRGKNGTVMGEWSEAISKSTLPLPPATPTNINTLSTSNTITLTWSAVGNSTSYDIEVDGEIISNGNSTNYVHTGLLPNTTHSYRVRSINPADKSQWSNEITATTLEENLLTPTNIVVRPGKDSIQISWEEIVGVKYEIEADGNIVDNGVNSVYTHSGLTSDSEHTYRVRTYKSGSYSDWSSLLTVRTKPDTFTTPSNIQSSATDTTVTITWEEVTDADSYEIEADGIVIDNGAKTYFTNTELQPDTSHTYKIRAKQGETVSEWSEAISVTTYVLATPGNITDTSTENQILVSWDSVESATSYEIKIDDNLVNDITDTNYTISRLYPGSQHKIQVRAINAEGTSCFSVPITVITNHSSNTTPQNVIAFTTEEQITLAWEPIEGADGYDVEVGGEVISNIQNNTYNHSNLEANTLYTYRIRINKTDEIGEWSQPVAIKTMPIAPGIPENVTAAATIDTVRLSWDETANAQEYEIEANGQVISAGASTNYLITGLTPNTDHTFKIRGKNKTSVSSWSTPITIKTKSSIQDYTLQGSIGKKSNLILNALNIKDWDNYTFTITYNPEELEIVDVCSQTSRQDLSLGNIIGTDIEVTQNIPGTLQFKKLSQIPIGQTYSGTINSIKVKFKTDAEVSITYTIQ